MKPTEARTPEELVEAWRELARKSPPSNMRHALRQCADDLERVLNLEAEKGITEMTTFDYQRALFKKAIEAGWTGTEPSVLGTYTAQKALREAEDFLRSVEAEKGERHV